MPAVNARWTSDSQSWVASRKSSSSLSMSVTDRGAQLPHPERFVLAQWERETLRALGEERLRPGRQDPDLLRGGRDSMGVQPTLYGGCLRAFQNTDRGQGRAQPRVTVRQQEKECVIGHRVESPSRSNLRGVVMLSPAHDARSPPWATRLPSSPDEMRAGRSAPSAAAGSRRGGDLDRGVTLSGEHGRAVARDALGQTVCRGTQCHRDRTAAGDPPAAHSSSCATGVPCLVDVVFVGTPPNSAPGPPPHDIDLTQRQLVASIPPTGLSVALTPPAHFTPTAVAPDGCRHDVAACGSSAWGQIGVSHIGHAILRRGSCGHTTCA
jgi:hypothetical protein